MKKIIFIFGLVLLLFAKGADAQSLGEKQVRIRIISEELVFDAVLNDSSPAQDLLKRLPIMLNLYQHQSREYYTNIRLDKNDATKSGYQVGDIAYWAPGNNLVFFYDKGYTESLIIMGKITSNLNKLSKMGSGFQVKIEKIEN